MKKYIAPAYDMQAVETEDILLTSPIIKDEGEATLGSVTGYKGSFSTDFNSLFFY